jgi:hypothetical protein
MTWKAGRTLTIGFTAALASSDLKRKAAEQGSRIYLDPGVSHRTVSIWRQERELRFHAENIP